MPCGVLGHVFLIICLFGLNSVWAYDGTAEELFNQADTDGDKRVSFDEARFFLKDIDSKKLSPLFKEADADDSGLLTLKEFTEAVSSHNLLISEDASPLRDQAGSASSSEMRFAKLKAKTRARASSQALASSLAAVTARKGETAAVVAAPVLPVVAKAVPVGSFYLKVDDVSTIYINNVKAGTSDYWWTQNRPNLIEAYGTPNSILIRAQNTGGPAAILASSNNGLVTNGVWRCLEGWPDYPISNGFNFLNWPVATVLGNNGAQPWGYWSEISGSAQYIWTNNQNSAYVTCAWQRACTNGDNCNGRGTASGTSNTGCTCNCSPGWDGLMCEVALPVCDASDCNGRGTTTGWRPRCGTCSCRTGFSGPKCENVHCTIEDCSGQGTPAGIRPSCTCACQNGYTGPRCQTPPVPCDASDCSNQGKAFNYRYQRCRCECNPLTGYTGEFCSVPPVPCDLNDCNRNGRASGYRFSGCSCQCINGYSGAKCTEPPDPCAGKTCFAIDNCHEAGTCTKGVCSNPNKRDGSGCDDGNPSTLNDVCRNGRCTGINPCDSMTCALASNSESQCRGVGRCEVKNEVAECNYDDKPDGTVCDDGSSLTKNDRCTQGICAGKDLCWDVICKPLTQCHKPGTCSGGLCSHPQLPEGTICDDGNPKTGGDRCDADGKCAGTLDPVDGGLSEWSACTVSCGGGTQTRACNSPAPANGGKPCCGGNFGKAGCPDIQLCNTGVCRNVLAAALAAKQAADAGPTDACTPKPCLNDGKCALSTSDSRGYHCTCFPGWSGDDCSVSSTQVSHSEQDYRRAEVRTDRIGSLNDNVLGVPRWGDRGEKLISEWNQYSDKIYDDFLSKNEQQTPVPTPTNNNNKSS